MFKALEQSYKYFSPDKRDKRLARIAKRYGLKTITKKIKQDLIIAMYDNMITDYKLLDLRTEYQEELMKGLK